MNCAFPEPLKEPVLRKIQFSTVSRIDNLVDHVFEDFKQDFYPGERVIVLDASGIRLPGVVREKARFPEIVAADGRVERRASSRYLVKLLDRENEEYLVDDEHLARDRRIFTKQMLRSFIKNTVIRESWNGAPWLVKPQIAEDYRIDTQVPKHLQYGNKVASKKANSGVDGKTIDANMFNFFSSKQKKSHHQSDVSPEQMAKIQNDHWNEYQRALNGNPDFSLQLPNQQTDYDRPSSAMTSAPPAPSAPAPPPIKYPIEDLDIPVNTAATPSPAPKCIQNDKSSEPGVIEPGSVGPLLEIWTTLNVFGEPLQLDSFTFDDFVDAMRFSKKNAICELFVEIHCAVLKLLVSSEKEKRDAPVQASLPPLPEESDEEEEDGDEDEGEGEDEDEEEPPVRVTRSRSQLAGTDKQTPTKRPPPARSPSPEKEKRTPRKHCAEDMFNSPATDWIDRLRRRDLRNGGWELIMVGLLDRLSLNPRLETPCNRVLEYLAPLSIAKKASPSNAAEVIGRRYSEMDVNLRVIALQIIVMLILETRTIRNFLDEKNLHMTESRKVKVEIQRSRKAVLEELRKMRDEKKELEPEEEHAKGDKKEKVQKSIEPDGIKNENEGAEKEQTPAPLEIDEVKIYDADRGSSAMAETDDDERPQTTRSLRGGADRFLERKRRAENERLRKEIAARLKEQQSPKGSKAYQRVMKKIEKENTKLDAFEAEIVAIDNELRETDCPRTRCLGRDRFWNRYFWFERNSMPFAGSPKSSTADAGYANARLWVQRAGKVEREGFLQAKEVDEKHVEVNGMTVNERRKKEQGRREGRYNTTTNNEADANHDDDDERNDDNDDEQKEQTPGNEESHHQHQETEDDHDDEWGYYDDEESLDDLLSWLDPRGVRENILRKEIMAFKDTIATGMRRRHDYLSRWQRGHKRRHVDGDGDDGGGVASDSEEEEVTTSRVSTRKKAYAEEERELFAKHRCLRWRNTTAMQRLGHLHIDGMGRVKKFRRLGLASAASGFDERDYADGLDTAGGPDKDKGAGERKKKRA